MSYELGIDLNQKYAVLSVNSPAHDEPETLSLKEGSEVFVIPYALSRYFDGGWEIGYEAANGTDFEFRVDDLFEKALSGKRVFFDGRNTDAAELFEIFIRNICSAARIRYDFDESDRVVVTMPKVTKTELALFEKLRGAFPSSDVLLRDHKEVFASYVMSQSPGIYKNAVYLYEFDGEDLKSLMFERDERLRPVVAKVKEEGFPGFAKKGRILKSMQDSEELDEAFVKIIKGHLDERAVSAAYLVGDGFENTDFKESVALLCDGRRVFAGQNLYSKGACCLAMHVNDQKKDYVYLGESKTKANLCLEVKDISGFKRVTLISAGENWYETEGEVEVISEEGDSVEFLLISPDGTQTRTEVLELDDLPERENRTTRLCITARPLSENIFFLTVRDLGFGELYEATNKTWEFRVTV